MTTAFSAAGAVSIWATSVRIGTTRPRDTQAITCDWTA